MKSSVLRYELVPGEAPYDLYAGEMTTAEGLALLDPSAALRVVCFGATGYKKYGWATEAELPPLATVAELRAFLESEDADIGLIDLAVDIEGIGSLSSHDDGECHFRFRSRALLMDVLKMLVPDAFSGLVIHALLQNPGLYITCDDSGAIAKYASFDAYLEGPSKPAR